MINIGWVVDPLTCCRSFLIFDEFSFFGLASGLKTLDLDYIYILYYYSCSYSYYYIKEIKRDRRKD
jgi:hypothetical protein